MKPTLLRIASLVLCTSLLAAWPLSSSAGPETVPAPTPQLQAAQEAVKRALPEKAELIAAPSLQEAVNTFFRQLAAEKGFEAWQQATWTSHPLGPGSHGWVILVKAGGQEIGYMVIHAASAGGYQLTEYGNGAYPLFSFQTLYQALVQQELIFSSFTLERWYGGPLQALWKLTREDGQGDTVYIDAKTGELLPLTSALLQESMPLPIMNTFTKPDEAHTIIETGTTAPFDPYSSLPWVESAGGQVQHSYEELKQELKQQTRLTYAGELYEGRVTVPLAVTGFQEWSDDSRYLRVQQDDERFIPYEAMDASSFFFP